MTALLFCWAALGGEVPGWLVATATIFDTIIVAVAVIWRLHG